MEKLNKVKVVIAGEIVTLKSTEKPEHMHQVAQYVDNKINEISTNSNAPVLDERTRSMRIVLNIADEHLKKMSSVAEIEKENKKAAKEIARLQEENKIMKQRVDNLQLELEQTQAELDEFIHNFDEAKNEEKKVDNILTLPRKAAN